MIVGMGQTGLSCARALRDLGRSFALADSRDAPPLLETFRQEFPDAACMLGPFDPAALSSADTLLVSPGVSLAEPALAHARSAGVRCSGDIDLFSDAVRADGAAFVAITGTNAKSTVTCLLGEMARRDGRDVGVGGNLGTPALSLLKPGRRDYVLELSSFQLACCERLGATVAAVLNMSPDHMDRHSGMEEYHGAKHRVFRDCGQVVFNRADPLTVPLVRTGMTRCSFGMDEPPGARDFGLQSRDGAEWLTRGHEPWLPVGALRMLGRHNVENALAALALGNAFGLAQTAMCEALLEFTGLPHRCALVCERGGVVFYDDSKGTNVAAAVASLIAVGEASAGRVVWIGGGVGKLAQFDALLLPLAEHARLAVLLGDAAPALEKTVAAAVPVRRVADMRDAVATAWDAACPGDAVLLSPACASYDMYPDYVHRGEDFARVAQRVAT